VKKVGILFLCLAVFAGCNGAPINNDYEYDPRCGRIHRTGEPCPIEIPEPPKIPLPHNHRVEDPCDDDKCPLHGVDW